MRRPVSSVVRLAAGYHLQIAQCRLLHEQFIVPPLITAARVSPMGFVVDKVALGQVFLRVLRFSPVNIIPPRAPHFRKLKKKVLSLIYSPIHSFILIRGRAIGP
jgi:hypothetical protein